MQLDPGGAAGWDLAVSLRHSLSTSPVLLGLSPGELPVRKTKLENFSTIPGFPEHYK